MLYIFPVIKRVCVWTVVSHEADNFTYDITDDNKKYLAAFMSEITSTSYQQVHAYMEEINRNTVILQDVRKKIADTHDRYHIDPNMYFGRRIGWYMLVRICKPKIIVETGVEKGLGACLLTYALMKNAKEGHTGMYYGTEIDPTAGNLFTYPYNTFGKILVGDSVKSLRQFSHTIDMFIHDSDHSPEYEMKEYLAVKDKLSKYAYVISDNAHSSNTLFRFAQKTKRHFLFFQEKPKDHWYPGAGIGVAYRKK